MTVLRGRVQQVIAPEDADDYFLGEKLSRRAEDSTVIVVHTIERNVVRRVLSRLTFGMIGGVAAHNAPAVVLDDSDELNEDTEIEMSVTAVRDPQTDELIPNVYSPIDGGERS